MEKRTFNRVDVACCSVAFGIFMVGVRYFYLWSHHQLPPLAAINRMAVVSILLLATRIAQKVINRPIATAHRPKVQNIQVPSRSAGFSFLEVLFAVILLGVGFIMIAGIFPVAISQTSAVSSETQAMNIARDALSQIRVATQEPPTTPPLLPPVFNASNMPIIAPLPAIVQSRLLNPSASNGQFGCVGFYRRDSLANPFGQFFVIALRNDNLPQYTKPIPIPPSIYGAVQPTTATIEGTITFNANDQTSSIAFPASTVNAVQGSFILVADDETAPQIITFTDATGTHSITIFNNAPLTGRFLQLGSQIGVTPDFQLAPGRDLSAMDMANLTKDGNPTGKVKVFIIGRAPLAGATVGDFTGPFNGPNQDIGTQSSMVSIRTGN